MKLMDANEERVIIRLDNGTIVIVNEEELVLKHRVGIARKTKKFGYKDMIMMNDLICQIMSEVIEERNKLKQKFNTIFSIPSDQRNILGMPSKIIPIKICGVDTVVEVLKKPFVELPFEEKTRK